MRTHLKMSPNLSATRIVRPSFVNATFVGLFGSSLWTERRNDTPDPDEPNTKKGRKRKTCRSLNSLSPSTAQTRSCLSSPDVARCVPAPSTAAHRTGPALSTSYPSRPTVVWRTSPVLGSCDHERAAQRRRGSGCVRCIEHLDVRARYDGRERASEECMRVRVDRHRGCAFWEIRSCS